MKNKFLTYFLLVLVVVVWGLIFMRLFNNKQEERAPQKLYQAKSVLDTSVLYSTYSLKLNYQDPFLGSHYKVNTNTVKKREKVKIGAIPEEKLDVQYLGMISNKKQKSMLAIIRWNGAEHYIAVGESIDGMELLGCNETTITLKKGKKKYIINK